MLAAGIVVMAAAAIAALLRSGRPAYRARPIMTPNEREFYGRLQRALPGFHICPQVAMHALLEPTASQFEARRRAFWRISQKVVDYSLFDADWRLVCVVELDDRTHDRARDAVRDSYFASAGVRTLRYESRSKPSESEIAGQVNALLQERRGHELHVRQ